MNVNPTRNKCFSARCRLLLYMYTIEYYSTAAAVALLVFSIMRSQILHTESLQSRDSETQETLNSQQLFPRLTGILTKTAQ